MNQKLTINKIELELNQPQIMGILNVTKDSFSDGGHFYGIDAAIKHAEKMIEQGASIIDVGGESTRPGAAPVSVEHELAQIIPVIEHLQTRPVAISVDTSKAKVMKAAVMAGAGMINDVCALSLEGSLQAAVEAQVPVCLMHMQGSPRTMQQSPTYNDVVIDITGFFQERIASYKACCQQLSLAPQALILDPGFGFGKTLEHNFQLLNQLDSFSSLGLPILAGISRKSMIGAIIDKPPAERVSASVACAILAWQRGARILRVHDVSETVDALKMINALELSASNNAITNNTSQNI